MEETSKLPDLGKYFEKKVKVRMQGNRIVSGSVAGFDQFMNLVLFHAAEEHYDGSNTQLGETMIRGSSIVNVELLTA
jgi:small nuclear ribonucleoprotein G